MIQRKRSGPRRREPALRSLKLTLTEACNLACPYCYQRTRGAQSMSLDTLNRSLTLARRLGRGEVNVVLSGGEPLLAPDLVAAVLDAAVASEITGPLLNVRLITNGTFLQSPLLERLVAANISVQVSCDGVAAAQDIRAPGSSSDIDRLLTTINQRHSCFWRRRFSIAMTVSPSNVEHLSKSVAWAFSHDVYKLEIGLACGLLADWGEQACQMLAKQMERVLELSLQHLDRTERVPVTYLRPTSGAPGTRTEVCGAADPAALAVDADGTVHGCGMLADVARWHPSNRVGQAVDEMRLGNVADPGFEELWRQMSVQSPMALFPLADRKTKTGVCGDCPQRDDCLVCPVAGPDPQWAPDAHCLFARQALQHRRAIPHTSPVESLLSAAGVPTTLGAKLSHLVWQARQEI